MKSMQETTKRKLIICVDDTDDLTKATSTGRIAEAIRGAVTGIGGQCGGITRHQLLIDDAIEYTSHNSSMCFTAEADKGRTEEIIRAAEEVLRRNMAETSDPGLCFCMLDELKEPDRLMAFGKRAQREVLRKQDAYEAAEAVGGILLREYGGSGEGVIGALAGAGLRLSGCDGTFRGSAGKGTEGQVKTAAEWKALLGIEKIFDLQGTEPADTALIESEGKFKLALLDHQPAMIVREEGGRLIACKKKHLLEGSKRRNVWNSNCPRFEPDNDIEECLGDGERACYNCLYRRWTAEGFQCVRKAEDA